MGKIIAVTGAVTTAARLLKEMNSMGCIKCRIIRTPMKISNGGCSYSIEAMEDCESVVFEAAQKRRITLKGIYSVSKLEGETVYNDISG